jgi:uncharacterized protein YndB with AHSA1/START domain
MIVLETLVRIDRPVDEVFAYLSEPLNFPRWNSAVHAVRKVSADEPGTGSTYLMERQLPVGRVVNELEVTMTRSPEFAIRTTSGPTPFEYRYRVSSENGATVVRLDAEVELGRVGVLGTLARKTVRNGVDVNLATLKRILEGRAPSS